MESIYVGIDVSKDRLDVHMRPSQESFAVARNHKGIAELVERLGGVLPKLVALEATGGFERIVMAGLAAAHLPVVRLNPAQVRHYMPRRLDERPRQIKLMPLSLPPMPKPHNHKHGLCRMR